MNLEQRVQALEQEVQLLKAQIQTTLLDIHEQMLNGTYPALRADEPAKIITPPEPEAFVKSSANGSRFKTVSIKDTPEESDVDEADEGDDEEVTPVRSVNHHKPARAVSEAPAPTPVPAPAAKRAHETPKPKSELALRHDEVTGRDWIELENWVAQKVERLGIHRTRELIRLYAQEERFSRQEFDLLMEFVNIYGESGDRPSSERRSQSEPSPDTRPSIVPETRAVVEQIRDQLRQRQAKQHKDSNASSFTVNERQELVLRLIAGILNAGDEMPSSNGHDRY